MITVTKINGDVLLFFEDGQSYFEFMKGDRCFIAHLPSSVIEVCDVVSVTNGEVTLKGVLHNKEYEKDNIIVLHDEIDRIDEQRTKEARRNLYPNTHKSGYAMQFMRVCNTNDIETVGQLLSVGCASFGRMRNMGPKAIAVISIALNNLYGIERW